MECFLRDNLHLDRDAHSVASFLGKQDYLKCEKFFYYASTNEKMPDSDLMEYSNTWMHKNEVAIEYEDHKWKFNFPLL